MKSSSLSSEGASHQGLDEGTHDIVTQSNVRTILIEKSIDNGEGILHPVSRVSRSVNQKPKVRQCNVQFSTAYHITDHQEVAMPADGYEDSCDSE
jgi:hypothetical protein